MSSDIARRRAEAEQFALAFSPRSRALTALRLLLSRMSPTALLDAYFAAWTRCKMEAIVHHHRRDSSRNCTGLEGTTEGEFWLEYRWANSRLSKGVFSWYAPSVSMHKGMPAGMRHHAILGYSQGVFPMACGCGRYVETPWIGLKIPRPSLGMWVRPPPPAPNDPFL